MHRDVKDPLTPYRPPRPLNGYKEDVSEKFPAFTREMWAGLGVIGRLAAATVNPTAASVPLTADAADGESVAKLVKAKADADQG